MALRALLFDLDDTLIPEEPALIAGYAAVAERVWGQSTPQRCRQLSDAARVVWHAGVPMDYRRRIHLSLGEGLHGEFVATGPEPDALRAFVPELHATAFEAVLPTAYRGRSRELVDVWRTARIAALAPYAETLATLALAAERYRLALVTNGASRLQRAKLLATGIERYFPVVVDSETVGVGKPDAEMFRVALADLGVEPAQAAMVGNDRRRDVAGARAAGVRPVWVDRRDDPPTRGDATFDAEAGDALRISDLGQLLHRLAALG